MNLVFYSPRFFPLVGGLEKVVRVWAEALTERGIGISVITESGTEEPDDFSFKVYRNISWFRQWQLMRQADVVVQFNVSLKGLFALKLSGSPLVISHHTALFYPGDMMSWQQRLKRWVSDHWSQQNICCSGYIARQFRSASVVYSPFEAGLFEDKGLVRKKSSMVYVGRLVSDKGADLLLQAFFDLVPEYPGLTLTIVGDGSERAALEQMASKSAQAGSIFFRGSVPPAEIVDILNETEIMLVPSRMEPFGTTVLEGLACGCRMIVSDQGGLPEAGNGWVRYFKSDDLQSLRAAMKGELEQPTIVPAEELGKYLEKYSVETTAAQFYTLSAHATNR